MEVSSRDDERISKWPSAAGVVGSSHCGAANGANKTSCIWTLLNLTSHIDMYLLNGKALEDT